MCTSPWFSFSSTRSTNQGASIPRICRYNSRSCILGLSHPEIVTHYKAGIPKHGEEEQYPELLFDPQNLKSTKWQTGQWWLHSSYNLCEGNGKFNVYTRNGTFQCAKRKRGWRSDHFPLRTMDVMTIQVALSKIGLAPGRQFGV